MSSRVWRIDALSVQLAVEHFDPLLELLDTGEQLLSLRVQRGRALPKGAHYGVPLKHQTLAHPVGSLWEPSDYASG